MLLYDIHNSWSVSPTASSPLRFLILFRDSDNMRRHFRPFKFAILSIAFVLNTSFWQLIRVNKLKIEVKQLLDEGQMVSALTQSRALL